MGVIAEMFFTLHRYAVTRTMDQIRRFAPRVLRLLIVTIAVMAIAAFALPHSSGSSGLDSKTEKAPSELSNTASGSPRSSSPAHVTVARSGLWSTPPPLAPTGKGAGGDDPVQMAAVRPSVEDVVNPFAHYSAEPAPMGMGDFGVSPYGAYALSTSEVLGEVSWNQVEFDNASLGSSAHTASLQLNVILTFGFSGKIYVYWIQDVVSVDTSTPSSPGVQFIDNVWNFTADHAQMMNSSISGNGSVGNSRAGAFYEDTAADGLPGNDVGLSAPGSLDLVVISELDDQNQPEVTFGYGDADTSGAIEVYDNVVFPFADLSGDDFDDNFLIDGFETTPIGAFYDAEITTGGPGGGSFTSPVSGSQFNVSLLEFNGNNFQSPLDAYNFGSDTAESVFNTSSQGQYSLASGTLDSQMAFNNTAGLFTEPNELYNQTQVGLLNVTDSALASGDIVVGGQEYYTYEGGQALLTLGPGNYSIQVGTNLSSLHSLGTCSVGPGTYDVVSATNACAGERAGVFINSLWSEENPVSVGEPTEFIVGTMDGAEPSFAWSGLPAGCSTEDENGISCTPTEPGFFNVTVTVTVGSSTSTAVLPFEVTGSTMPLTVRVVADPNPVTVGSTTNISTTVMGGTGPYDYSYGGLPSGCVSSDI
ncbi:MAG: thermopsin, partial [Thermoplasmata archaeon]